MLDPTVLILANETSKSLALGDVKSRVRQHVAPGCSYPNLGWHSEGDKLQLAGVAKPYIKGMAKIPGRKQQMADVKDTSKKRILKFKNLWWNKSHCLLPSPEEKEKTTVVL